MKEVKEPDLEKTFNEMSKRYAMAVKNGTGMRLSAKEVHALLCMNWNTMENPYLDD